MDTNKSVMDNHDKIIYSNNHAKDVRNSITVIQNMDIGNSIMGCCT